MKTGRAVSAGLVVVVLWASAFPAIRVASPELGVVGLSIVRLGVATCALMVFAAARGARLPRRADLGWILAAGFFGMTAYQVLLNESELHVPAGTASVIVAAAPLVSVAVARLLFDEQVSAGTGVGSAIALAGVAVVCLSRAGVAATSAVWVTVGAMVVQGVYHPLQRPLLRSHTGLEVATYTMVAGTAMTLPLLPWGWGALAGASTHGWAAAVYLGLLPSGLGFVLWAYAVGQLPVATSTSLLYLVPPVAVLIAWLWLGEVPLPAELLGGTIVIVGVLVISRGARLARGLRHESTRPSTTAPGELRGRPPTEDPAADGDSPARAQDARARRTASRTPATGSPS